ncbi:hypothetical protein FRC05_002894 [Tulasnella sp. 425]|nr:hypothetical protein FRC05_002894 [Tulasnella sp. 425]
MTGRLPIPSDSDDSFPINSPHPRHIHRYSQSSGDIRVDSMGDPAGVMGVPRSNPPNPIEGRHRLAFNMQDSSISVVGGHTGLGPAVKPTLNAQGQKTCRQCGQPGREQDGKCAERLGPAGRGTVCDQCRKKMKRVERCGTQNAGSLGQHLPLGVLSSSIGGRHGRAGPNAVFPVPEAVFPSPPPVITHLGGDGYRNYEPAPAQGGTPRVSVYSITDEEDEPEVVPVAPPREPTPPPPSPPQPTRRPKGKGKRR